VAALEAAPGLEEADEGTTVTCWDAVLVYGYRAGQVSIDDLKRIYALAERESREAFVSGAQDAFHAERREKLPREELGRRPVVNAITPASIIKNRAVRDFLVGRSPRRLEDPLARDQLTPGEVVLIEEETGDLSHVALATTSNLVTHLWTLKLRADAESRRCR
jgi:hypothetical protein